jgi:hypothetical protein
MIVQSSGELIRGAGATVAFYEVVTEEGEDQTGVAGA